MAVPLTQNAATLTRIVSITERSLSRSRRADRHRTPGASAPASPTLRGSRLAATRHHPMSSSAPSASCHFWTVNVKSVYDPDVAWTVMIAVLLALFACVTVNWVVLVVPAVMVTVEPAIV